MATSRSDAQAQIDVRSDGSEFKIDGVGVTSSAADVNLLDGAEAAGVVAADIQAIAGGSAGLAAVADTPAAELASVDPSQKVTYYDDFLGDTLLDELTVTVGGGTGNAAALSAGQGGRLSLASASDDGAFTANATSWSLAPLDWRADSGGLVMETRIQCDDVSEAYIFIGFTDVAPGTTHEQPIFLNAADIDSDADNACGVLYDVDGTTKEWLHGGVKATTDTTPAYSGAAPTEATYETIRVEVSAAGAVQGFVNGTAIGAAVANAVTATTPLCPVIVVANRSANQVTCLVDYVWVQANR